MNSLVIRPAGQHAEPGLRTWHRLRAGIIVACMLGGLVPDTPAADAPVPQTLWQETQSAATLAGGLTVRLSQDSLRDGEPLVIRIALPQAGYLNLVSIGPDGEATVLFPNRYAADNHVTAGNFAFPTEQMQFDIPARAPFGRTLVAAFLSQEKLDFAALAGKGGLGDAFASFSPGARSSLAELGTRSLAIEPRKTALVLGGSAEVLTCAATGPCDTQAAEARDLPERRVPGIFLDPDERGLAPQGPLRKVSAKGLQLTEASEGFVPHTYNDAAKYCTIAYGHLLKKQPCDGSEPEDFVHGVTRAQGADLLATDMAMAERAVQSAVTVPLSDGQFAALSDFTYNVGAGKLRKSDLLKRVNQQDWDGVESEFLSWVKAGGKVYQGLVTRRQREVALFFEGQPRTRGLSASAPRPAIDILTGEPSP